MKLEIDPARLKHLRTRIHKPLDVAARAAGMSEARLHRLETQPEAIDIETLHRLAKIYGRNWYAFLLTTDEVGVPAVPKDFRRLPGGSADLSHETYLAFERAGELLSKIHDLPRDGPTPTIARPAIVGLDAEEAAGRVRASLGVTRSDQATHWNEYPSLEFWIDRIGRFGIYTAQLSFPYAEVRAFCLQRGGRDLIVISSQDGPRPRAFSALHELGHLLLGHEAMCSPEQSLTVGPGDEEVFCNRFAAAVLMPAGEFSTDPEVVALSRRAVRLGDGRAIARRYGVSELAVLRRLATLGFISENDYARLHRERDRQMRERGQGAGLRIRKEPTRMINENSRLFAAEVVDAFSRGDLAFAEVGRLLNGNLKHYAKIKEKLAR